MTHQTVGMATVQGLADPPKWLRRIARYVVDGVVIGVIAGGLSSNLVFAALIGVAEMLLRPLLDTLLEAKP